MKKKVTIKTISESAGVSPSIVSRIFSGKAKQYRIAQKTERKVLALAEKLGYRPNYFAKSLNSTQTFSIGLIFANTVDSFLGSIMEGVEARLRDTEYQMVVATCDNSPELERVELERMLYRQTDGIIIYPSALPLGEVYPTAHLAQQKAKPTPFVVIGREIPFESDFVLFSDYEAGELAARNFLDTGCRKFAAVTLPIECSSNRDRIKGFTETLEKAGIDKNNIVVSVANPDNSPKRSDLKKLEGTDAMFAINSSLLVEFAHTLAKAGVISSLKGYAPGMESFQHLLPLSGTFLPMPGREMGWQAADILLDKIISGNRDFMVKRLDWPEPVIIQAT